MNFYGHPIKKYQFYLSQKFNSNEHYLVSTFKVGNYLEFFYENNKKLERCI